jgi:uncharacterized protein YcbK (DUF882 family)
MSRRTFLKAIITIAASYPFQKAFAYHTNERVLNLYNIHTGEELYTRYAYSGIYDHDALDQINYVLRCHYTNDVMPLDISLLNLLCDIKDVFGKDEKIDIISGYRSYAYNEYLRFTGHKVVKDSLHMRGLAVDFSIPGINSDDLFRISKSFGAGGVGKYPEFVHIDVGHIRYW